ncbi:hypothetical protein EVAR_87895_1 [Eumeta japonica]|uniref:Uncharacterized protein n=1 Tax=Eumeta variegata TaxID=151549 RepID=A0A4C1WW13_EUMVA|nr:hypothetical protein EVAR_87895_1 [Eumeta japonica]
MNDDELISRRKNRTLTEYVLIEKEKDLGAMPSTSTVQSGMNTRLSLYSRNCPNEHIKLHNGRLFMRAARTQTTGGPALDFGQRTRLSYRY